MISQQEYNETLNKLATVSASRRPASLSSKIPPQGLHDSVAEVLDHFCNEATIQTVADNVWDWILEEMK